jgi:hypothetical protein
VNVWKLRQGKTFKTNLPLRNSTALALQQPACQRPTKLKEFEKSVSGRRSNLRFSRFKRAGGSKSERWPEKPGMARYWRQTQRAGEPE